MTLTAPTGTEEAAAPKIPVATVFVSGGGPAHEVRAMWVVVRRDLTRFWVDRGRMVSSFMQPLLFLFVLGKGLGSTIGKGSAAGGADYSTFLFPGTITTGVLFSAIFSAISIVWDREFGFLREMLVAPVSRTSIIVGKCVGGAVVATLQGVVLLALGGLVHVPYNALLILGALGLMFLTSMTVTALGLVLSVRVTSIQTVMPRVQLLLAPLMFASGSLYPIGAGTPTWLRVVVRINPLSYAVDAMRRLVFHFLHGKPAGLFTTGITWDGWVVPVWLDVVIVAGIGAALLAWASVLFARE